MYKKLLSTLFLLAIGGYMQAQITVNGSFVHNGITRTYSYYVPASYVPGQAAPLVLNLHGYTSNGSQQAAYTNFNAIADTAGFIVVHPDGTIEPSSGQRYWNFGILGSTINDIGFLEALVDTLSAHYSINQNRVYSVGMSNGGFMSYCLACESNRFAAVGSVTGSMSIVMYNTCTPAHPIPTIHIHGTNDAVVSYIASSTTKSVEDISLFWANNNGCNLTPGITSIPNINTIDNATAERYLYSGGNNGHTVELFKVTGGGHTWPGGTVPLPSNGNTCMDFSASKEIWRFFSQYELNTTASIKNNTAVKLNVWPNPTQGDVYIQTENNTITDITIMDTQGRIVEKQNKKNIQYINLSHLNAGNYVAKISGNNFYVVKKLTILPRD